MWPDRVSNPGPSTYESGALPIALRGPACIILNAELNVDLTAQYSRCMFLNAELNVEPIARYSNSVLF